MKISLPERVDPTKIGDHQAKKRKAERDERLRRELPSIERTSGKKSGGA